MNDILSTVLPMVATALGGPLAGMALTWFTKATGIKVENTPDIVNAISGMSASERVTLQSKEMDFKLAMAQLGINSTIELEKINASVQIEVNRTMQFEASSEHWPSYSWRPFIGFSFGFYILSLLILPMFKITPVIMNPDIVFAIGGILGVASYFRGKAQADPMNKAEVKG